MPLPERKLIAAIRRMKQPRGRGSAVVKGIGDDCAVLRPPRGHELLVTTDFNLEGTHFRREWHPAETVGHRCLARGLSDIAAMGGEPMAVFLSLALPGDLPQRWIDDFLKGMLRLARRFGVELAGGDVSTSPSGVLADIVVLGAVPRGRAVLRSGARPGDRIYVTGALGGAAAVLSRMYAGESGLKPRESPRHFYPEPRVEVGRVLQEKRLATAMIDVSDGLSVDLAHICEESGAGAEIDAEAIPRERGVDLRFALHGGDDYELIFTARRRVPREIAGVSIREIGVVTRGRRIWLRERGGRRELQAEGWQHFAG